MRNKLISLFITVAFINLSSCTVYSTKSFDDPQKIRTLNTSDYKFSRIVVKTKDGMNYKFTKGKIEGETFIGSDKKMVEKTFTIDEISSLKIQKIDSASTGLLSFTIVILVVGVLTLIPIIALYQAGKNGMGD